MDDSILEHIEYSNLYVEAMDYNICRKCKVVDKDDNRTLAGQPCTICKAPSEGGYAFFGPNAFSMIELLQESYQKLHPIKSKQNDYPSGSERAQSASTVIFFCTLKEILLEKIYF